MSRVDEDTIGARVALLRKQRGISQQRLAAQARLSKSLLSKVETGQKPATPAFVSSAARALHVDVTDLTGQPYRDSTAREDGAHAVIPDIRRALLHHELVPEGPPRPLGELADEVARAHELRQAAALTRLGSMLPALLMDLQIAAHQYDGAERAVAFRLLAETYADTGQVVYKLGYLDLDALTVERLGWAAGQSDDPLLVALHEWLHAGQFMQAGSYDVGLGVVRSALDALAGGLGAASAPRLSMWGMLHLKGALIAARAGDPDTVWAHLGEAEDTAARLGYDRNDYQLAFGPTNVGIYKVAAPVEMGQGTEAVKQARHVHIPANYPRERASHHYIDLARGQLWHGDRHASLDSLLKAEKISPEQARNHPMVRETTRTLIRLERQAKDSLRGLANRIGLPD